MKRRAFVKSSLHQVKRAVALTVLALTLSTGTALAQTGRVEGTVRAASGDPIAGAQVTVVETGVVVATDERGQYVIEGIPVGTHTLKITAIGYQISTIVDQAIKVGQSTTVDGLLELVSLRIEGVLVTGVNQVSPDAASGAVNPDDIEDVDDVHALFQIRYDLGQFSEAQQWCEEGLRRTPEDYRFTLCQIWMMLTPIRHPDIDAAWELGQRVEALTSEGMRAYNMHESRMIVGGVIARVGLADSANAVLNGAKAGASVDPSRSLLRVEAVMRILGREYDRALDLLEEYHRFNPDHSFEVEGRPRWFWTSLHDDPRFKALQ